jgi:hypothetical protein
MLIQRYYAMHNSRNFNYKNGLGAGQAAIFEGRVCCKDVLFVIVGGKM